MIRYCPSCWAENAYEAGSCTTCGASLDETGKAFADRLVDAIGHPEPTRAVIAVEILGRMGEKRAVEPLMARLARKPDSMDVTAAVATALGLIGDPRATQALAKILVDSERPLPARLAAAEALAKLDGPAAHEALTDALALPGLPRLLRRVIESLLIPAEPT